MRAPCLAGLVVALAALGALAACGAPDAPGAARPAARGDGPDAAPRGPGASPADAATAAPRAPGALGDACAPPQHRCADGLECLPGGGGLCAAPCGDGCGERGLCVEGPESPGWCLRQCSADADCRVADGHRCDPRWHVCTAAALVAPPPSCAAAAELPRARFAAPVMLDDAPGRAQRSPRAGLTRAGDVLVAYESFDSAAAPAPLGAALWTIKDDAVLRPLPAGAPERHAAPALVMDAGGRAFVASTVTTPGGADAPARTVARWSDDEGRTWSAPIDVLDAGACAAAPCAPTTALAAGRDPADKKRTMVHAFAASGADGELRATRSTDRGATWSTSVAVGPARAAAATVASDGRVHVVRLVGAGDGMGDAGFTVEHGVSTDGGLTWSAPVRVSAAGQALPVYFSGLALAVDDGGAGGGAGGAVYVAYPVGGPDGKWDIVLAASPDGGATWTHTRVNDDAPCANHMTPAVAVDERTGEVHVAWVENRGGQGQVALATCAPGGATCGPSERVSERGFARYGFARQSAASLGERLALVVDGKRRRLHAVWSQPVRDDGAAASRVYRATARLEARPKARPKPKPPR